MGLWSRSVQIVALGSAHKCRQMKSDRGCGAQLVLLLALQRASEQRRHKVSYHLQRTNPEHDANVLNTLRDRLAEAGLKAKVGRPVRNISMHFMMGSDCTSRICTVG